MKRSLTLIFVSVLLIGIGIYYYTNLDNKYDLVQEFNDFPIPSGAKLESENQRVRNYKWEPSTGTEVPFSYRLMIRKSGWNQVKIEGANIVYEKDGEFINLNFATGYIELSKESK
jgi:hypothetical protein